MDSVYCNSPLDGVGVAQGGICHCAMGLNLLQSTGEFVISTFMGKDLDSLSSWQCISEQEGNRF